jgi:LAO/AO transport system ATPase
MLVTRPIRVLISKIGLDGHDRGAKLIVRNLRDAGMAVIYTGLFQTPAATVYSALQEDVDVLGVSVLSAAHMSIMPEVVRLCRAVGIADTPVVVGGIVPEQDHRLLKDAGVAGVFNPGTPTKTIIESITLLAQERRSRRDANQAAPDLTTATGLARAITLLTDGHEGRLGALPEPVGPAIRIGVTGSPGVGKSTLIGRLARDLRARGRRVAVIAIDPTSPLTGGSLLGDRLRMMPAEPDDGMFVRSLSSSGETGGLAPKTAEIAQLLEAAGFEMILIETVGAGQNDVAVRNVADHVLLLLMPSAGDAVQFTKAGVVEIATGFVVNKADLPGADKTIKDLRDALDDDRPIWPVNSLRGEGLEPLCEWIEQTRQRS